MPCTKHVQQKMTRVSRAKFRSKPHTTFQLGLDWFLTCPGQFSSPRRTFTSPGHPDADADVHEVATSRWRACAPYSPWASKRCSENERRKDFSGKASIPWEWKSLPISPRVVEKG